MYFFAKKNMLANNMHVNQFLNHNTGIVHVNISLTTVV